MTRLTRIIVLICVAALLGSSPTSAYAISRATGDGVERVQEIKSLRETNSETYLMSDGSYECVVYAEDKYFFDETNTLQTIDNSIVAVDYASRTHGQYKNASNAFDVYFSENNNPGVTISYRDSIIAFEPVSTFDKYSIDTGILTSSVTSTITVGKIEGCDILDSIVATGTNTVKYTNVFNKTDLVYVVDNSVIKEYIIINENGSANCFDFVFELNDLSIQEIDGQYCFVNAEGNIVFALGSLYAVDSNGVVTESVSYTVSELDDANKIQIRVSVDEEYLHDSSRVYPVVVDPTVMISSTQTADAYVSSANTTTNYYLNDYLRTGQDAPYGIRRSYIKFSIPSSVPRYSVTSASLALEKYSGVTPTIRAYRCSSSWNSSSITWANKPAFSYIDPSTIATVRSTGSSWYEMDVTKIVQSWVNGKYTNYGFVIKDITENDATHWTTFYSSDAASPHKPELHITYYCPTVNLDLIYDNAYNNRYSSAGERVTSQAEALKEKYLTSFGINVNYYAPNVFSSYADSSCTTSYSARCSHATDESCVNSVLYVNGNKKLEAYHHTNIFNIMLRVPFPNMSSYVRMAYIGHNYCAMVGDVHRLNPYYGLTYESIGLVTVMNFSSAASETKTMVHEFGHLYKAPDHYGNSAPTTEEIIEETGDTGFSKYCIYGEYKDNLSVINNLTICDGCSAIIAANRSKYDH